MLALEEYLGLVYCLRRAMSTGSVISTLDVDDADEFLEDATQESYASFQLPPYQGSISDILVEIEGACGDVGEGSQQEGAR